MRSAKTVFAVKMLFVFVACVAAFITSMETEFQDFAFASGIIAFNISGLLINKNMGAAGHGVNDSRHIASMPIPIFFFYLAVLALVVSLSIADEEAPFLRMFALSGFFGWVTRFVDWYAISYGDTFYVSEHYTRSTLKTQGLSDVEINWRIENFRQKGFFRPPLHKG